MTTQTVAEEQNDDFPESWVPENAGDSVEGKLVRYDKGRTDFGDADIAVLETDEGQRGVWLLQTSLRSQFARHKPEIGETIRVKYRGRRESKAGRQYHDFRVVVTSRQVEDYTPDWSSYDDEIEEEDY